MSKVLTGFHAVTSRLRQAPDSVSEIYIDATRADARARDLRALAERLNIRLIPVDAKRLDGMAAGVRHQGVVAQASTLEVPKFIEDVLESLTEPALFLILDGVQDPHNLGACLRVADGAGAHAVIAPKDRSVGLTTAAIKVASGAAESVPSCGQVVPASTRESTSVPRRRSSSGVAPTSWSTANVQQDGYRAASPCNKNRGSSGSSETASRSCASTTFAGTDPLRMRDTARATASRHAVTGSSPSK